MRIVEVDSSGSPSARPTGTAGTGWWVPALAGAGAFWGANFVISLTPVAADYRSALSIGYLPMLIEAAAGGLVIAVPMAAVLARHPERVPGADPLRKALWLTLAALALLTVLVELPAKFLADVNDPGRWLMVATAFNAIRLLALGVTVGRVAAAHDSRALDTPTETKGRPAP